MPLALLFAALAIAARVPFLISGRIPFDSDEAVEGLMARHLLGGELPAFFWGQLYKGVPEVYASAGVFAMFGSTVNALKSVTLAFFAAYVALNFILLDKMASRWIAVAASLLLVFSPPAFVLWTLSASAEYVLIMLLGTVLLLLCVRLQETHTGESKERATEGLLAAFGVVTGLGLWVHQLFAVYLLPVLVILTLRSGWWRRRDFGKPNMITVVCAAAAILYLALGLIAFLTGGFSVRVGSFLISATAPQKMIRIAAGIAALAVLIHVLSRTTAATARVYVSRYWPLAAGFCVGYLPVLLYSVLVAPARSPARVANLRQLLRATPDIAGNIIPIVAGFKLATTERLALPLVAAVPGAAALAAYLWINRHRIAGVTRLSLNDASVATDFFPLFVLFVPAIFLMSGVYIDTQSYRYLIPWYAGISVAWATGALIVAGARTRLAAAIVAAVAVVQIAQQTIWYQKLMPDTHSLEIVDCLKRNGVRGGFGNYWTSYKLTFLTREEIIIAPTNGVDRYPKYTEFVSSLPAHLRSDNVDVCR